MLDKPKDDRSFRGSPSQPLATLLVAAPYLLVGAASLAFQHYFAAGNLIWLPAAIDMGFVLVWGEKALLGIGLSALALGLMARSTPFDVASVAIALVSAVEAMVEALLGFALVRGIGAYPREPLGFFSVMKFLFLAGGLACAGAAAVYVGLLWLMGAAASSNIVGLYFSEALQHALGIAAGAPIVITLLCAPIAQIQRRLAPVLAVSAFALGLDLPIYSVQSHASHQFLRGNLAERTRAFARQFEASLRLGTNAVGGIAGLFDGDNFASLRVFQGVAKRVIAFDLGIRALEWIPIVKDEDRAVFESDLREQWRSGYGMKERDGDVSVSAAWRPDHYPIAYVYPLNGNEEVLGFDLASNVERKAALDAARLNRRSVVSAAVKLMQSGKTGFLFILPVSGEDSQRTKGFAVGVLSAPLLLEIALRDQDTKDIDFWVIDATDLTRLSVLASNTNQPPRTNFTDELAYRVEFDFGERKWAFELAPTPAYLKRDADLARNLTRATCLLLTAFLSGAGLIIIGHQRSLADNRERALEDLKFALDQHAIVSITGPDGRISYANEKFCNIAGYSRASLIGQRHNVVASGLHGKAFYRELWGTITAGRVWTAEVGNRAASGEHYWLQSTIVPLVGQDGSIAQFIDISTDITKRKQLEDQLRSQEQRLSIALSASSTGLWDYHPATDEAFYSETWYTMLGYRPGEIAANGETFRRLMHPEDSRAYRDALETHAGGSSDALKAEFRLQRKDGGWSWIKSVGRVIERGADGLPSRLIGVHIDITGDREAQTRIAIDRDEAKRANQAKTEFLATMSHEIRTPMNGVIGMIPLLEDTSLNAEQQHYVRTIRHSGEALMELINEILDFSKLEAGAVELESREFSPSSALENALDIFEPAALKKGLRIELRLEGDRIARGLGDPTRLRQILLNLCSNAVKFTQEGVVSLVMIGRIDASGEARLRYEVRDTGIGVSLDKRDRLFKPFSQGDASVTRRFGGTGLGLVISKRLAEAMHGEMSFDSVPGGGSVFWLDIPIVVTSPAEPPAPGSRRRRVALQCAPVRGRAIALSVLSGCEFTVADDTPVDVTFVDAAERERPNGPFIVFGEGTCISRDRAAAVIEGALAPGRIARALASWEERSAGDEGRAAPPLIAERSMRVLIAEDHPTNQDVLSRLLQRRGHQVEIANSGREAIDLALSSDYDLIFMDVQMPEVDGLEATRRIRAEGGRRGAVCIVAMTASAMPSDMDACRNAGMDDYLSKPINRNKIDAALANAAARLSTL